MPNFLKQIRKNLAPVIFGVFFLFSFLAVAQVVATSTGTSQDTLGIQRLDEALPLAGTDVRVIIFRIINVFLSLLGIAALGIVIYGGSKIMFSGGEQDKINEGKKILINGVIGLAIILSAWGITRFILSRLARATGTGFVSDGSGGVIRPPLELFGSSGSLGRAVRDHYPSRGETDVPRNARVLVTFREALTPESVVEDTNRSGVFGDCVPQGGQLDWERDCDRLNTSAFRILTSGSSTEPIAAAALLSFDADGGARTVMARPLSLLGSATAPVGYRVELTRSITASSTGQSVFQNDRSGSYVFGFETGTSLDETPPTVVSVSPRPGSQVMRNAIVQINFSEPMDPTSIQGVFPSFTHILVGANNQASTAGEWRVSNGYRTVEFVPSEACGRNSCGDTMYCLNLPNCTNPDDGSCSAPYRVLVRTAELLNPADTGSFAGVPFSGVMDLVGNVLDSAPAGLANPHRRPVPDRSIISASELFPDNYSFSFEVFNSISRTVPYLMEVTPPPDTESVPGNALLEAVFSEPILSSSLSDLLLEEYPVATSTDGALTQPWFNARVSLVDSGIFMRSRIEIAHREFGVGNVGRYYFMAVPSSVKNLYQNCFYPGIGPNPAQPGERVVCTDPNDASCISGERNAARDTVCLQRTLLTRDGRNLLLTADVESCFDELRSRDISPTN